MSKTVSYNSIEYIQNDKALLEVILKDAVAYSRIEEIMQSGKPPHTKLALIHEVIND